MESLLQAFEWQKDPLILTGGQDDIFMISLLLIVFYVNPFARA